MKSLMNFSDSALSRTEMKSIKGGGCQICSMGPKGGTCGQAILPTSEAKALRNKLNASNDGYYYYTACKEQ